MAVEKRISAAVKGVKQIITVERKKNTGVAKIGINNPPVSSNSNVGVVRRLPPREDELVESTNAAISSVRRRTNGR